MKTLASLLRRIHAAAQGLFSRSLDEELTAACNRPIPGSEYVHPKTGNRYTVLAVAIYCGRQEQLDSYPGDYHAQLPSPPGTGFPEGTELVVYVGHYDNKKPGGNRFYVRPLQEWLEEVTLKPPHMLGSELKASRFVPVEE